MSPVSTAARCVFGKASKVRSSRVVLPEPGELIRFTQKTPCSRKRSRSPAANRSFSFRTLRSSGTRFIFFDLHVRQFQLVSTDTLRDRVSAGRASKFIIMHSEFGPTHAPVTAFALFNVQLQSVEFGILDKRLKAETKRLGINAGQFADAHSHA